MRPARRLVRFQPVLADLPEYQQGLGEAVAAIPPEVWPILLQVLTADEEHRAAEIGTSTASGSHRGLPSS